MLRLALAMLLRTLIRRADEFPISRFRSKLRNVPSNVCCAPADLKCLLLLIGVSSLEEHLIDELHLPS